MPRGSLMALGLLTGLFGVTAEQAGRYAGVCFALLFVLIQVGERGRGHFRAQR